MSTPTPSVLIVDDDDGLLVLIARCLKREGLEIFTAASCEAASRRLREFTPSLLLLDLKLPDAQGHELIERLGAGAAERPFIIMTGQGDERVAVEMMKRGALDYLVKDRDFLELLPARVGRALLQLAKDRKIVEAEEALRREHAFTNALLHTSAALVVVLDGGGRIVRFNPACERMSGFAFSEVQGRVLWEVLSPAAEQDAAQEAFQCLWERTSAIQTEQAWLSRGGERRLIAWSHAALRDAAGRVEHVMGTGIDITDRRRLEQEILQVSEMEQRRIGHDLHDGICQ